MAKNEIGDYSETDASNTDVSGIAVTNSTLIATVDDIVRAIMGALKRWFRADLFRLRDNTDQTKLLAFDLSGLTTATTRTLTAPDESARLALASHLSGYLYKLTLTNNAVDAVNDIDIAAGCAIDTNNVHVMTLASALTKRLDAAWAVGTNQGGLDTGTIANTTYHVFLIKRTDTGVVDVLFSASLASPTLPTNYTLSRRIGSIIRTSGSILGFSQIGDQFLWTSPVLDVNATNPGTSTVNRQLTVPAGIVVDALLSVYLFDTGSIGSSIQLYLSSTSQADLAASGSVFTVIATNTGGAVIGATGAPVIRTNSSSTIRTNLAVSAATTTMRIQTNGYIDNRGRV